MNVVFSFKPRKLRGLMTKSGCCPKTDDEIAYPERAGLSHLVFIASAFRFVIPDGSRGAQRRASRSGTRYLCIGKIGEAGDMGLGSRALRRSAGMTIERPWDVHMRQSCHGWSTRPALLPGRGAQDLVAVLTPP